MTTREKKQKDRMEHKRVVHTPFATIRSTIRSLKYRLIDSPERLHKLSCSLSLKEPWPKCLNRPSRKLFDKSLEASERLHPNVLTHVRVNRMQKSVHNLRNRVLDLELERKCAYLQAFTERQTPVLWILYFYLPSFK